jgi:DNA polymerase-4
VTTDKQHIGSAIEIARQIKQAIKSELQLTASAGVSVNKFIAKIASDLRKPDGLAFIGPSKIKAFMEQLPVEKFHGVGKVTATKMKSMGLYTGADIKKLSEQELTSLFGKAGHFYYHIVRGIDHRKVEPHRETKSVSAEDTFAYDLTSVEEMNLELDKIAQIVFERLTKHELWGRTITLKIKYSDFRQITRNHSFAHPVYDLSIICETSKQLLASTEPEGKEVRLLGISLSNFCELLSAPGPHDKSVQLRLFP